MKGLVYSAGEIISALKISCQALKKSRDSGRVFVVTRPTGEEYYPAFYLSNERKAIEAVSKRLGTLDGRSKWSVFTTPKLSLGGQTPIQALGVGKVDAVLAAAGGFLEA